MKIVLSLAVLFAANSALACPDLSGEFLCTYEDGKQEAVTVSQVDRTDGTTVYTMNDQDFTADGVINKTEEEDAIHTYTIRCNGKKEVAVIATLLAKDNSYSAFSESSISRTATGGLQEVTETTYRMDQEIIATKSTTLCTPK